MSKFAVIESGGKQYRVSAGSKIKVEKLNAESGGSTSVSPERVEDSRLSSVEARVEGLTAGGNFVFDKVLLRAEGDRVEIGTPYVSGAKVEAKILGHGRGDKKIVFKYHQKTRYKKKKGHRQHYTEVMVGKI